MIAWLALLLGCDTAPLCERGASDLAAVGGDALTCDEAAIVPRYVVRLAGRELAQGDRQVALIRVRDRFTADPAGTHDWIRRISAAGAEAERLTDMEGSRVRSHAVWLAASGQGPITESEGTLWNLQSRSLSVWARDDEEQLALTESDIEGWIRYVSLCREAQGDEPLRLSIADRVTVYQMAVDAWNAAEEPQHVAMASMGAYWPEVRHRWAAASYEAQQAWIAAAPLPPRMTSSSLGYTEAILRGDLTAHASALQRQLGPFTLGFGEPAFAPAGAP